MPEIEERRREARFDALLKAAAEAYEDGRDPFSTVFLSDHEVTLEECQALSNRIALLIQAYLASPEWIRNATFAAGAVAEFGGDVEMMYFTAVRDATLRRIRAL